MLTTPFGKPTSSASTPQARPEYGVCEAGLTTAVQPAASAGAELARQHRGREIPRRDRGDDADRLLGDEDAAVGPGRRHDVAIGAAAFFGEPQHIGRRDRDLALRLGQRLALLGGQQFGQRLLVVHDGVVQLAQQLVSARAPRSSASAGTPPRPPRWRGASRPCRISARCRSSGPSPGLITSIVAPESACTHSPPIRLAWRMKWLVFWSIVLSPSARRGADGCHALR